MYRFHEYLNLVEGKSPIWVKGVVLGIILKIRSLHSQIVNEKDSNQQNKLISQQNKLLSYISGLGIGFSSNDKVVQNRLRTLSKK